MKINTFPLADNAVFGQFASAATRYTLDKVADARDADFVSIWVTSTLNQAVTLQVVANDRESPSTASAVDIGEGLSVPSGATITQRQMFNIELSKFRAQYYGMTVLTGASAPTAGRLDIVAHVWIRDAENRKPQESFLMRPAVAPGSGSPFAPPPGPEPLAPPPEQPAPISTPPEGYYLYTDSTGRTYARSVGDNYAERR